MKVQCPHCARSTIPLSRKLSATQSSPAVCPECNGESVLGSSVVLSGLEGTLVFILTPIILTILIVWNSLVTLVIVVLVITGYVLFRRVLLPLRKRDHWYSNGKELGTAIRENRDQ